MQEYCHLRWWSWNHSSSSSSKCSTTGISIIENERTFNEESYRILDFRVDKHFFNVLLDFGVWIKCSCVCSIIEIKIETNLWIKLTSQLSIWIHIPLDFQSRQNMSGEGVVDESILVKTSGSDLHQQL